MPRFQNLSGMVFGDWTVIRQGAKRYTRITWLCRCACGGEHEVTAGHLKSGASKRCVSCRAKNQINDKKARSHPLKSVYENIKQRCHNKNNVAYKNYGARGITICERWRNDFWAFVADMGERPSVNHTIERIDNDKGYSPENCIWATRKEQMRNTRRSLIVNYFGEKIPLVEACERSGKNYHTMKWRLKNDGLDSEAWR